MRFVVTVLLLWPSDDTVAHSEGASRHVHQGGTFAGRITFRRLEGGLEGGTSSPSQGGFKGA